MSGTCYHASCCSEGYGKHIVLDLWSSIPVESPDSCPHITATCGKDATSRAWCDRDDRVLVPLQHKLSNTSMRIPELNTPIFGTTKYPIAMGCKGNTEDEVLVAFKGANALASWLGTRNHTRWSSQLPHLDGLVQTTADKLVTSRGERSYREIQPRHSDCLEIWRPS